MTPRERLIDGAILVGTAVLVVLAVRADLDVPEVEAWQVAADVAVGVAFILGGRASPAPAIAQGLFVGVGATWLVGSFVPDARLWHQAVLAIALLTFPSGRIRTSAQTTVVAMAVVLTVAQVAQVGVALLFCVIAAMALLEHRDVPTARWFPVAASAAVGVVLAGSWAAARRSPDSFDPVVALSVYEAALLLVASTAPLAARAVLDGRNRLVDRFLGEARLVGLEGLDTVLRDALADPTVRVRRWDAAEACYVASDGSRATGPTDGRRWLPIADDGRPVAAVELGLAAVDDAATTAAVDAAVRLALANLALQDELDAQLTDLEAARGRLVAAGDRQREATAERLRRDVLEPLGHAAGDLRTFAETVWDPVAADALAVVVAELTAASSEIGDHVTGVPATYLGAGRLVAAIGSLADSCALPVDVDAPRGWEAGAPAETALFYVCSEALANVVKHARASRVSIAFHRSGGEVSVRVADDGMGGADPHGSGLQGVADRLAARGGRLQVESPPGAGTTLTATVPG